MKYRLNLLNTIGMVIPEHNEKTIDIPENFDNLCSFNTAVDGPVNLSEASVSITTMQTRVAVLQSSKLRERV